VKQTWRLLAIILMATLLLGGCFGRKKAKAPEAGQSAEPDKVLYENALADIQKGNHAVGRLTLQTLINTYPDSEYLAKAKLAVCESFYKEGGTSGLTQAAAECKDFITFFPFLDEAAYAQMLIAQSHYRRMEKPDRDRTQARLAEAELQDLLLKYPESKWAKEGEQRLREVQEVLAEADYRVGTFYYHKDTPNAYRASIFRLADVVDRYPLYSQSDRALWMLGDSLQRLERSQLAVKYFERIVRDYPLSPLVADAKQRLEKLGAPIPQPDPKALERMTAEANTPHPNRSLMSRTLGVMRTGPDVSSAARIGTPNMEPPKEAPAESLVANQKLMMANNPGNQVTIVPTDPSKPPTDQPPSNTSASSTDPSNTAASSTTPQKDEKDVKENAKPKESSSKKKKGLRKIIPW
jgi:outer membrane protein assembly factor BamD